MGYLIFLIVTNRVLTLVVTNKRGNMSEAIKKIGIPTATIASALLLVIAPAILSTGAFAIAPTEVTQTGGLHFVGQPDLQVNKDIENGQVTSASLTATGEVAGAGRTATATLSATAEVTQGCINRGGGDPQGLQRTTTTVTGSDTFNTRQGRGTFDVTTSEITAPSGGFTCPSRNMTPVLVSVDFTDITLTVTSQTGTTTATFPDQDP